MFFPSSPLFLFHSGSLWHCFAFKLYLPNVYRANLSLTLFYWSFRLITLRFSSIKIKVVKWFILSNVFLTLQDPSLCRRLPEWISKQLHINLLSDFCCAASTFRHRRVPHLSWPLRTGQVRQHTGRLWVRVLWRLWERLHDDEKLHGWVQSFANQATPAHTQGVCSFRTLWIEPLRHLRGIPTVSSPTASVLCYSNALLYLCNACKPPKDVSIRCTMMGLVNVQLFSHCLHNKKLNPVCSYSYGADVWLQREPTTRKVKERVSSPQSPSLSEPSPPVSPRGLQVVDEVLSLQGLTRSSRQLMSCKISRLKAFVFTCV